MPVTTMSRTENDKFDSKKAYQAQEEEGVPFVSVPMMFSRGILH